MSYLLKYTDRKRGFDYVIEMSEEAKRALTSVLMTEGMKKDPVTQFLCDDCNIVLARSTEDAKPQKSTVSVEVTNHETRSNETKIIQGKL